MSKPNQSRKRSKRARTTAGLTLSRCQADELLKLLHRAAKAFRFEGFWDLEKPIMAAYARLAEQYADAGYDVEGLNDKKLI